MKLGAGALALGIVAVPGAGAYFAGVDPSVSIGGPERKFSPAGARG
jgi:hypothetical protein